MYVSLQRAKGWARPALAHLRPPLPTLATRVDFPWLTLVLEFSGDNTDFLSWDVFSPLETLIWGHTSNTSDVGTGKVFLGAGHLQALLTPTPSSCLKSCVSGVRSPLNDCQACPSHMSILSMEITYLCPADPAGQPAPREGRSLLCPQAESPRPLGEMSCIRYQTLVTPGDKRLTLLNAPLISLGSGK